MTTRPPSARRWLPVSAREWLLRRLGAATPEHSDPAELGSEVSDVELDAGAPVGFVGFTPEQVRLGARVLATEDGWLAVFVVTGYPSEVYPGWLDPLLGYPGRLDVSVHIDPVDPLTASDRLRKQLARLESGRRYGAEHQKLPDPLVEAATEDAYALASRVARGEGKLYRFGLYLAVHATDPDTLAEEVAAVRALASSLLCHTRPASFRQWTGWTACLPVGIDQLDTRRVMDTAAAAVAFPFTSPDLPNTDPLDAGPGDGVLYGFNLASSGLVYWDRYARDNYNSVVLGQSGSGKSYFVKLELLRSLYRGVHGFVIDPEDEYTRLTTSVGGTVVRLGAPGVHFNPLDLPIHTGPAGGVHAAADTVTGRALFLHTFIAVLLGETPDPMTRAVLDDAITTTYARAGITQDNPASWLRPAPGLPDLAAALRAHPDPAGLVLAARLRPFSHGAHSHLFTSTTAADTASADGVGGAGLGGPRRLVSFSLRALPDQLRAAATLLVLDHIWRRVDDPADLRRWLVVIDEAWMFMAQPDAAAFLARMAKAFRKRGAGLCFASQDVADVLDSELGLAVITNSATQILFRQAPQTIDRVALVFALTGGQRALLLRADPGAALLCGGAHRVAFRTHASAAESALVRTDPAFLASLADAYSHTATIHLTPPASPRPAPRAPHAPPHPVLSYLTQHQQRGRP